MKHEELILCAKEARKNAYAPYSGFHVGAALLCEDGTVYTGCNIENSSYPAGICAERTAVFKAVSEGKRKFRALAIVGAPAGKPIHAFCTPCGICRQVLSEFAAADFPVCSGTDDGREAEYLMGELLPEAFSGKNLFSF